MLNKTSVKLNNQTQSSYWATIWPGQITWLSCRGPVWRSISYLLTSSFSAWPSWWGWSQDCRPGVSGIGSRISPCCNDSHSRDWWRGRRTLNSPRKNLRLRKLWSEMRSLTAGIFSWRRYCDGWDGCWTCLLTHRCCCHCNISDRTEDVRSYTETLGWCGPPQSYSGPWWPAWRPPSLPSPESLCGVEWWSWPTEHWALIQSDMIASSQPD